MFRLHGKRRSLSTSSLDDAAQILCELNEHLVPELSDDDLVELVATFLTGRPAIDEILIAYARNRVVLRRGRGT